ncbi:hypothetical protein QC763_0100850 [Podospora pseudopauciseta]|uniref:Secreted protein n=2 Tax=Podospora TaxID=5144 RepID=A0ABR0H6J6_9PEZI|nr:hypothetical protein QC763_0100850 [Podospora pseudopauciseta]KAK4671974.1 hypothetical protein QC764_0100740 [Podospora pseudoanserina]
MLIWGPDTLREKFLVTVCLVVTSSSDTQLRKERPIGSPIALNPAASTTERGRNDSGTLTALTAKPPSARKVLPGAL